MTQKFQFRSQAKDHRDVARLYFESGDDNLLFASALRLRMSIECLAYDLLQALGDDVSYEVMETWQPSKLIKELKEIDKTIDQDISIRIGIKGACDQPDKEVRHLGTAARLSAKWINEQWNALGSYLHAPTIKQIKNGRPFEFDRLRGRIEQILPEIDRVLESNLFSINIRETVSVACKCGFVVKRRESQLENDLMAICAKCGAMLGAEQEEGQWRFFPLFHAFDCPSCKKRNKFPANELKDGVDFVCDGCGALVGIEKGWCVRLRRCPDK